MDRTGGYDMHCHILWGVDDGSQSSEMSLDMIESAYDQGIRHICLTPHFYTGRHMVTRQELEPVYEELCRMTAERHEDMTLYLGQELAYDDSILAALEQGLAGPLGQGSHVLVEFWPGAEYKTLEKAVYKIQQTGYTPVIAHMERVPQVAAKPKQVKALQDSGALVQINLEDLLGNVFQAEPRITRRLVKEQLVDLVGTDAHRSDWRPVIYREPIQWLEQHCPREYLDKILYGNPARILQGE